MSLRFFGVASCCFFGVPDLELDLEPDLDRDFYHSVMFEHCKPANQECIQNVTCRCLGVDERERDRDLCFLGVLDLDRDLDLYIIFMMRASKQ